MYVRNYCPNVTFEYIGTPKLWLAKLFEEKRLVWRDDNGLFTKSRDNIRLDVGVCDILACIPKAEYNALVKEVP